MFFVTSVVESKWIVVLVVEAHIVYSTLVLIKQVFLFVKVADMIDLVSFMSKKERIEAFGLI